MSGASGRPSSKGALLPWTPHCAAHLATTSRGRFLLGVGFTGALLGVAMLRVAFVGWLPAVNTAATALPERGGIDDGQLVWPEARRTVLADNGWLAIVVDPTTNQPGVQAADLQLELTTHRAWLTSFLGYLPAPYLSGYVLALNREEFTPLWAAWRPYFLAGVFGLGLLGWSCGAGLLAMLLAPMLGGYLRVLGRAGGFRRAWRLGMLVQAPGCWLFAGGLVAYSFRFVNVPLLVATAGLGIGLTCLFLLIAPWHLPTHEESRAAEETSNEPAEGRAPERNPSPDAAPNPKNPFAASEEPHEKIIDPSDETRSAAEA